MFKYLDKRQYGTYNHQIFSTMSKGNENFIQRMSLLQSLDVHHGCVNSVIWDDSGEFLLSGSDDQHLIISAPWDRTTSNKIHTAHRANIFSAKFIPCSANRQIISCSGDGMLIFTDLDRIPETYNCKYSCHIGSCYDVITITSEPCNFFSCGEDGTVRWYDLRVKTSCLEQDCKEHILLNMQRAVTAIAVNPMVHFQLAVSTQDSITHIFDRRMLGIKANDSCVADSSNAVLMRLKPESLEGKSLRVTSLRYSSKGNKVLASYSSDYLYLFDIQSQQNMYLESTLDNNFRPTDSISSPSLKKLRLRGDWSDTGPQALPESELTNQVGDVGQARPTLHSTLMQRMADILSRMLPNPSNRLSVRQGRHTSLDNIRIATNHLRNLNENSLNSLGEVAFDRASTSDFPANPDIFELAPENSSLPSSISFPNTEPADSVGDNPLSFPICNDISPPFTTETPLSHLPVSQQSGSIPSSNSANFCDGSEDVTYDAEFVLRQPIVTLSASNEPHLEKILGRRRTANLSSVAGTNSKVKESLQPPITANNEVEMECCLRNETATVKPVNQESSFNSNPENINISCVSQTKDGCSSACDVTNNYDQSASGNKQANEKLSSFEENNILNDPAHIMNRCTADFKSPFAPIDGSSSPALELSAELAPSTSVEKLQPSSSSSERFSSPDRGIQSQDEGSEESTVRSRHSNSRLAWAIERVRQQMRDKNKPFRHEGNVRKADGDVYDKPIPYGLQLMQYKGHRNARTMIKEACFWGEKHIMSGSDCGRVFVWEIDTGRLIMLWEADRHVVNCLQPHPTLPILATSGIDYDIKLWAPLSDGSKFDEEAAFEIAKRNETLLSETRDTVTVPATFMIRMLSSLNQLRRDRLRSRNRNQSDDDIEE